jgi:hypothetical protein
MDGFKQGVFGMCIGPSRQIAQEAVRRNDDPPVVQPTLGKLYQSMDREGLVSFASHPQPQHPLAMLSEWVKVKELYRPGLVIVYSPVATIERAKRGEFRGGDIELGTQMLEHRWWQAVKGVQWASGHFDLADLQGNRKAVGIAIARENSLLLQGAKRKKVADFEFRKLRREL